MTNGKVRISADFRTNALGGNEKGNNVTVALGSDSMYNGNHSEHANGICARAGVCAKNQAVSGYTYRRPLYFTNGVSEYPTGSDDWVKQGTWLRLIMEVDLDANKYSIEFHDQGTHPTNNVADGSTVYYPKSDIAVYDMGTEHPTFATATPATPIETFSGIKFRRVPQSLKGISSLCILAQGTLDNTLDKTVGTFWDNILIDYTPPGMKIVVR